MSLENLEELFKKYFDYRELRDQMKAEMADLQAKLDDLEAGILDGLDAAGKTNWELPDAKFHISEKCSFTIPKDPDKMEALRQHLERQGLRDMLTVNSAKLNSWANQEVASNPLVQIPGLELPTTYKQLNMRKK